MELTDVLLQRRSIRKFKEDKVSDEIINELLHAAMSGPSACNKRPWDFYVVKNEKILKELKSSSLFTRMNAPLAIIVCGNLSRSLPFKMSDYWIQDCSAATENILLRVTDLGLGAVWCGAYPQQRAVDKIRNILNLSEKQIPLNIIYIGYKAEEQEPRDQYDEKRVHIVE